MATHCPDLQSEGDRPLSPFWAGSVCPARSRPGCSCPCFHIGSSKAGA